MKRGDERAAADEFVGRSGVYCGMLLLIERIERDICADLFGIGCRKSGESH